MARVAYGHAAQRLDSLRNRVVQRQLLIGMLVQQQLHSIKSVPAHGPVRLLVKSVKNLRIGQNLVEPLAGMKPCTVGEP